MIAIKGLSLTLGGSPILREICTSFRRGRLTAIIGANGAGKSSLVRCIAGLVKPDAGEIDVDGTPLSGLSHPERAKRVGYLPQNGEPAWNVTAFELAALGRLPHRSRFAALSRKDREAVAAAMDATDTAQFADRTIGTLSGGEKARVKMARVLAGEPQWILADEPLANLDPPHQRDLLNLLHTATGRGQGAIVVLHQLDAAGQADDILILKSGRAIAHGPAHEVLTPETLMTAFGMHFDVVPHRGSLAIIPSH